MHFVRMKLAFLAFILVNYLGPLVCSNEVEDFRLQLLQYKNVTFVISGRKIPTQDTYSEVDAYVKVSCVFKSGEKERLGRTSIIRDEPNPQWNNVFWVEWRNGTGQKIEFVVKDHDFLDADDEAGEGMLDLDEFVTNHQNSTVGLSKGGKLLVEGTQPFHFKLYARNVPELDRVKGAKARGDPYVNVYWRQGKDGPNRLFATSSVLNNNRDPDWPELFEFANYQQGTNQYLFFQVQDHDFWNKNEYVGDYLLEADSFVKNSTELLVPLEHGERSGKTKVTFGIIPTEKFVPKVNVSAT